MTTDLFVVFLSSMAGAWFGTRVHTKRLNRFGAFTPNLIGILIVSIFIILYAGWRNNVGDTYYYLHTYHLLEEGVFEKPAPFSSRYLFELFQYELIHHNYSQGTFVMVSYLIFAVPAMIVLAEYSVDYTWAIFFFFVTGTYLATMNGIRQFMAAGILLIGTWMLLSPKRVGFIPYLILIIIAFYIHSASLIMIPIYFICRQRAWSLPTVGIILAGAAALVFVSLFSSSFMDLLQDTTYSNYTEGWFTEGKETGTTIFRVLVNWLPAVLAAYYTPQLRTFGPSADILINISVVHAAIYMISLYNWIFARFTFFTCIYVILLLAMIMKVISEDPHGKWVPFVAVVLFFIFFVKDAYSNDLPQMYGSIYFTPNNNKWFEFLA